MIHQSAFNDVVTLLNKNAALAKGMVFEKAYSGVKRSDGYPEPGCMTVSVIIFASAIVEAADLKTVKNSKAALEHLSKPKDRTKLCLVVKQPHS